MRRGEEKRRITQVGRNRSGPTGGRGDSCRTRGAEEQRGGRNGRCISVSRVNLLRASVIAIQESTPHSKKDFSALAALALLLRYMSSCPAPRHGVSDLSRIIF